MRSSSTPAIIYLSDESGLYPAPKRDPLRHAKLYAGAALGVVAAQAAVTAPAFAQQAPVPPIPVLKVGDTVYNPVTGGFETVTNIVSPVVVLTNQSNTIFLPNAVGQTFRDPQLGKTYTVTAVNKDANTGRVTSVVFSDGTTPTTYASVTKQTLPATPANATNGSGSTPFVFPIAGSGDVNIYAQSLKGNPGGEGGAGGGVKICGPLGCLDLTKSPTAGGQGATPADLKPVIDVAWGKITTESDGKSGVTAVSVGGNGGKGGSFTGVNTEPGAPGGKAGQGGLVEVTQSNEIVTTGKDAHGVYAQSASGTGGEGGAGYIAASGGSGGTAGQGGTAKISQTDDALNPGKFGQVTTRGDGSYGLFAQSLGGASGGGGDSIGITGKSGGGSAGGNGGEARVFADGTVHTFGKDAHALVAQSVGGDGGRSGTGVGIVTFGGDAGPGGNGGIARVVTGGNARITTERDGSFGLFAQSVGGGGGTGGLTAGLVAFGSDGGTGGNGGAASATVSEGSLVQTKGASSIGVFVESVGGGGGTGGISAAGVALGGKGQSGGNGGSANGTVAGTVLTAGDDARGLLVQSVGGGGGAALGTGGLVALGGAGGKGGTGGAAFATVHQTGQIVTTGRGADALFVQSVGGGGGVGSSTGGLVALGGTGGDGGNGGAVTASNAGLLNTANDRSRGLFAQSIGGGGGAGGDSGGLVTLGGNGAGKSQGGDVTVTNTGTIATTGTQSTALYAQSIGGGGGDGGTAGGVLLTIGGNAGGGGNAGVVKVTQSGAIATGGDDSHGIFAQAVGGGGGNGGNSVSISAFVGAAVGGKGGEGGEGGTVDIDLKPRTVTVDGKARQVDSFVSTEGDRARGIQAQSVGGGGGNGGFAGQGTAGAFGAVSIAVGGTGGKGGKGGAVSLDGNASLVTAGDFSEGVLAQSVGGGGGSGGFAVSIAAAGGPAAGAVSVGVGGSGEVGGKGGTVDVNAGGAIVTKGDSSTGLIAQSVGGGGGSGGFAVTASVAGGIKGSGAVSVGVGGSGAGGGEGDRVNATFEGSIATTGDKSGGAVIQSVGGGGGTGGFAVTASVAIAGGGGVGVAVGVGGSGGGGGIGGSATGRVGGAITTAGDDATGMIVQSVGGGGGNGGFTVSGAIGGGAKVGGAIAVGIGGTGAGGGDGGRANGTAGSTIATQGDRSDGFVVQSAGGGGGNGGFSVAGGIGVGDIGGAAAFGMGGAAGGGGAGGEVHGYALGAVGTTGDQSRGVVVQSSGGGGGNGGFSIVGGIGGGKTVGGALTIGLGGAGGSGGAGGKVTAEAVGITTTGDQSGGFLAQSKGGGGGAGGFNVSGSIGVAQKVGGAVAIGLGGAGGGGGGAEKVTARVVGDVTTGGIQSDAIVAQSVGGGGGAGGFNVSGALGGSGEFAGAVTVGLGGAGGGGGDGGDVALTVTGAARTAKAESHGIFAQSVGGGGGAGGFNVSAGIAASNKLAGTIGIGLGGSGGLGGDATKVELYVNQSVAKTPALVAASTGGSESRGVTAQSVGGGGGSGGFNVTGGITAGNAGGNIGIGLGGSGGDGGDSGAVIAKVAGTITTGGDQSTGALFQSVGGGGGSGGFNVTGGIAIAKSGAGNLLVGIGGSGGLGGNAGSVDATTDGAIATTGIDADGLTVQSMGGGGGNGAFNVTGGIAITKDIGAGTVGIGVGGFGGGGGNAAGVIASHTGTITTTGAQSHGALVQSAGGGGGNGGINVTGSASFSKGVSGAVAVGVGGFGGTGGDASTVDATLTGNVSTDGAEAAGATIQSVGGGGGNGGINVSGALSFTADDSASLAVGLGVGGFGGTGGNAQGVVANVGGDYRTKGASSGGVLAQSQGGGGGAGGINVAGALSIANGSAGSVAVGIGGFGGDGGTASTVALTRTGNTVTTGKDSDGVVAQSVGGGGGKGGINISGGIAASLNGDAGTFSFGLGGFGGGGGTAGDVTATVTGNVLATGSNGAEFLPERVQRGWLGSTQLPDAVQQALGGANTIVPASRRIADGSHGVVAQSVGGGGGAGALNVTGNIAIASLSDKSARSVALGVGGFGGTGGDAGKVDLTVKAPGTERVQLVARGDEKSAALAQSVGGGGGAGGINVSGSVALDGQVVAGIGGFGGTGGIGRDVSAKVDADLTAQGQAARGLFVQSVGGGGGAGGINISGGIVPTSNTKEPSLVFGLGGFGGAGNISGNASADHNGRVVVDGKDATGILVQSVAGGGGAGGLNVAANVTGAGGDGKLDGTTVTVGVGGKGGLGADAGKASLVSTGDVFVNTQTVTDPATGQLTYAATRWTGDAPGVVVQSIGGGGGTGGINIAAAVAPKGAPMALAIGGSGGAGGDAGEVSVVRGYRNVNGVETQQAGTIRTYGENADGLIAQSIGGGGGNAGINIAAVFSNKGAEEKGEGAPAVAMVMGGSGGDAGNGKAVTVRHAGDILTFGEASDGIQAMSVSKGGGSGNFNFGLGYSKNATAITAALGGAGGEGGEAGRVDVDHSGFIHTEGDQSVGIRAQAIGGGGGNASFDVGTIVGAKHSASLTIGKSGGKGGTGGDVKVVAAGRIETAGTDAQGILAQSIGGGGGASGSSGYGVTIKADDPKDGAFTNNVNIGLDGAEGGEAKSVTVANSAVIATAGVRARGITAQSIGGGGGIGGGVKNIIFGGGGITSNWAVGGKGGDGAKAGKVDVGNTGAISTTNDEADGILAQSIGGGGGIGGNAMTIALVTDDNANTSSIAVGGNGGKGGTGGQVIAANGGLIKTTGRAAYGIRAQSIGGGGGFGGAVINVRAAKTTSNANSFDVNVGGTGGQGEAAGSVEVTNTGAIWTTGAGAMGISANSIGGGGGDGGMVLGLNLSMDSSSKMSTRTAINVGGDGAIGGAGGTVKVTNRATGATDSGRILTEGPNAHGIFAQSLGGGGGNASSLLSLSAGISGGKTSLNTNISIGGKGGSGNTGGAVEVVNAGLIQTKGDDSHGVLAQSIGGGGGNGSLALSLGIQAGTLAGAVNTPTVAIGGRGGAGGDGGKVVVTNTGTIQTTGARSHGVVAQSIGGGGGNAGLSAGASASPVTLIAGNAISALVGAFGGGSGGIGGEVVVNHSGDIFTSGEGAKAIVAESINGGGGSVNLDLKGVLEAQVTRLDATLMTALGRTANPATADPLVAIRAGADGAFNTTPGRVTINSSGRIGVQGDNAAGIATQALGGGGGTVNVNLAEAKIVSSGTKHAALVALGGSNGSGNAGAAIGGGHTGTVGTTGKASTGVLVQTVGGGGGIANVNADGTNGGLGPVVTTLGAENVGNSAGGSIDRTQSGAVGTKGDLAPGALVQSVGGGGGSAMIDLRSRTTTTMAAKEAVTTDPAKPIAFAAPATGSAAPVAVTLGASGGAGLDGGSVVARFDGGIATSGANAPALVAQSIGGGGGETRIAGAGTTTIALGGANGATGNGGSVTVANTGQVYAEGAGSHGVFVQSVGGGGGAAFGDLAGATVTLSAGNAGDGGAVRLDQRGDVAALGANATAVIAQSVGGGGGFVDGAFAGTAGGAGRGGAVSIAVDGSVFATGTNGTGVFAQSEGRDGAGNLRIDVSGTVRGGSGTGAGIRLAGGADNLVTVGGTLSAVSGNAVVGGAGNDRVENGGLAVGNVRLGAGDNALLNRAGATFVTMDTIDLSEGAGSTGTFTNAGTLALGLEAPRFPLDLANGARFADADTGNAAGNLLLGTRTIANVTVDGDFVQTATGRSVFDVAFGPYASDRVNVTGNTRVAGTADVNLTWLENAAPVTLFATQGTATDAGLTVRDTIALDYRVLANSAGIQLAFTSNFGAAFLNRNERALGGSIDSALTVGGSAGIGRLAAFLGGLQAGQEAAYAATFAELNPEPFLVGSLYQFGAARDFSAKLFGCGDGLVRGASCTWSSAGMRLFDRKGDVDNLRIDSELTGEFRLGGEVGLGSGVSLAGGLGYDNLGTLRSGGRFTADGDAVHGGVGVRLQSGGFDGSIGASAGRQWLDTTRTQSLFGAQVGQADQRTTYYQGSAAIGYLFDAGGAFFARPALRGWVTALRQDGFAERGLAGLGVVSDRHTQTVGTANPELTVGARLSGDALRGTTLTLTGGGIFHTEGDLTAPFRLAGSNPIADPARISSAFDKSAWRLGAGVQVTGNDRLSLRVGYDGEFGKRIDDHRGTIDLRLKF